MSIVCPCCGSRVETGVHPALERLVMAPQPPGKIAARCLTELIASFGKWVPTQRLVHAVYWDRPDGGPTYPEQTIRTQLRNERHKIASLGLRIESHRDGGYRVVWRVITDSHRGRAPKFRRTLPVERQYRDHVVTEIP